MTAEVDIVLFAEDAAHEGFLTALVTKIATELGLNGVRLRFTVRNATGGKGRVMKSYTNFIRDFSRLGTAAAVVIVALDSDCRPRHQVRNEVMGHAQRVGYAGPVVGAIPVPHVEKWYVLDDQAFRQATGATLPNLRESCEPDYYKQAIIDALRASGIEAPLAAAPYAEDYVAALDIQSARQSDNSFDSFYEDLRQCLISYE